MSWDDRNLFNIGELERHSNDPHVKPINDYVLQLREQQRKFVPFVSPGYGGVDARLLAVQKSPGVRTKPVRQGGTGFLDVDNPDPAAKRHGRFLAMAGIDLGDTLSWNSLPWFDADFDDGRQLEAGVKALATVIDMLDNLSVVMLHGSEARAMWRLLEARHRSKADRFRPIETRSLGAALVDSRYKSQAEIDSENARILSDFRSAARRLRYAPRIGTRSRTQSASLPGVRDDVPISRPPAALSHQQWSHRFEYDEDGGREWPLLPEQP
ncbi:hypothetical protein [Gordonia polyisoprenivorans]|uniref:hypothetical protein n=1 Tax=Gordonia polyisoprenivorans TaxID=84595 RepID=UPI00230196D2|nr:hypothetical protein [Gordonia polyisoprenivorans]WCB37658.1 hypothetical protein PHA63_00365 [Gordonia polyisoprenivorans]